jgi:transcriptional regulator with XRE-family HTH domain
MDALAEMRNLVDRHVGGRTRIRRLTLGLTFQELADEVGMTVVELQRFEQGFDRIDAKTLLRIAKVFDISAAWFFESFFVDDGEERNSSYVQST